MKIDRRSFLSLGMGVAAGTALSPLPWKLIDDISIWTQMWPWTPVPEVGEVKYVNSTCTLCPGGCGITVRKVDDRAVKVEGKEGHPINSGGVCLLGLSGLQLLYGHDRRIKTPLKRIGNRGQGSFQKISWDEAISEIVNKLSEVRSTGKAPAVSCISGSDQGTIAQLLKRFLTAYGSPNFFTMPSVQDSYELALYLTQGIQGSVAFDVENSDFVLSFGSGIIEGWGSPVRMFQANSHWREGKGKVVQIEPRLSITAAKADKWIPIKPGTEAALALGLASVIIKESLYNKEFIENYAVGFDTWKDANGKTQIGFKQFVLEGYSPDKVAKITGIDKSAIQSLARSFVNASKPLAIGGRNQGRSTAGRLNEFMAIYALNALVGNINKTGGVWSIPKPDYIKWPKVEMDAVALRGIKEPRIDAAGSASYPYSQSLLNRVSGILNSAQEDPIQVLFVAGANPIYGLPNTKAVRDAFDKIPYIVGFSSYLDETAKYADIILPNHVYLERYEDIATPIGFPKPFIGLAKPVIAPQFETKNLGDTILLLAKGLGGTIEKAFPWDDYETCLKETLSEKWDSLEENGFWIDSSLKPADWKKAFKTKSNKFEFIAADKAKDIASLYGFSSSTLEGDEASYPLVLIPYDSMRLANGFIGDPPFVMKAVEDTVLKGNDVLVEVNPETAMQLGLSEGRFANLATPVGTAKVRVHLFDGIMPGIIAMPRGLGHTAYDKFLGGKGVNFNELVGSVEDSVSGLDATWGIRAKLTKA